MGHGPSFVGEKADPNLTPLLDMVLQLLMFFMMCVNFVSEQVNEDVRLPRAQAARPMDKGEVDVLFLNVLQYEEARFRNSDTLGKFVGRFQENEPLVLTTGRDPMRMTDVRPWLRQQYADARRLANGEEVQTAIIIRADQAMDYGDVFLVMQICKEVGYRKLNLRALTKSS